MDVPVVDSVETNLAGDPNADVLVVLSVETNLIDELNADAPVADSVETNGTGDLNEDPPAVAFIEPIADSAGAGNGTADMTADGEVLASVETIADFAEEASNGAVGFCVEGTPPESEETAGRTRYHSMECPGCGEIGMRTLFRAGDRLYQTTDKYFLVVECRTCRLIRLEPRPTPQELASYYPPEYWYAPKSGDTASWFEESYRRLVLRDHVKFVMRAMENSGHSGPVLDVGCGGGLFLKMLRERGLAVLGLETSEEAATAAWRRNRVTVVCGDLGSSPIDRGTCAAITMFHVLEHLHDPVSYLRSARDLLLPGGRLVVQVPNASCWQFLMLGERWSGVDVPRHLVNYRQGDLESLLDYCGFEVVRRKHFSLRDNPAGLATSGGSARCASRWR